jgi:AcrR family transcriptional regulator
MTRTRTEVERKQEIRAAAMRCFVRRGYSGTRLSDIAREAGMSKGGLYFHYRAKEELFADILETQLDTLRTRWSFDPVADESPDRTLQRLVVAHLRSMESDPDEVRLYNLLLTLAPRDPVFRRRLAHVIDLSLGLYAEVLERGIREGVFTPADPRAMAKVVLATVQGACSHCVLDGHGRLPLAPEEIARHVLVMVGRPSAPGAEFRPRSVTQA